MLMTCLGDDEFCAILLKTIIVCGETNDAPQTIAKIDSFETHDLNPSCFQCFVVLSWTFCH